VIEPYGPRSYMFGLIRGGSLVWADRAYTVRDRSNHSGAHGSLAPVGTMSEGIKVNSKEGLAFRTAIRNLQNPRSGVVLPHGSTVEAFEPMGQGWQVFSQVISGDNEDIELAWCGVAASGTYKSIPQLDGVRY